jgi:hypothetical protein
MILVTFISIHFVIICDVLLWRTYETHLALSLKSGCDKLPWTLQIDRYKCKCKHTLNILKLERNKYTIQQHRLFKFAKRHSESRLEGVNRQNLKIINFEHALHQGLGLETNNMNTKCRR